MKRPLLFLAVLAAAASLTAAPTDGASSQSRQWIRNPQISPKGDKIVFTYKGDIWTVPVKGGSPTRLTTNPAYDTTPFWSPDGEQISFASNRHGNFDVFLMDAAGGPATRLTTNSTSETPQGFSPDGKEVYFTAAIQAPARSSAHPTSRASQTYAVSTQGGRPRQVFATPAELISFGPNADYLLYQDSWSMEDKLRKHHTSSAARNVWMYDAKTGHHTNLTAREGEDRNPVVDAATSTVYFLSERDGDAFNLFSFPLSNPKQITRLTKMGPHPVRFLSRADNGTLAFGYDGDIYTLSPTSKTPQKVEIAEFTGDFSEPIIKERVSPSGAVVSPDGKQIAFISRGDVFVTSVEYPTTKQITHTPQAEKSLSWGADNRTLYYDSDRDGTRTIYRASLSRPEDPDFANATFITETPLFPDDGIERSNPNVSPDGKKMTYSRNRVNLYVTDVINGTERQLTDGNTYNDFDDEMQVVWSPDSRWLTLAMVPEMHNPYSDIALLNVETGELTDLTQSGYFESEPRFVLDGNAILYATDRYAMRNHASWGSQYDLMLVFLNREARDRYLLSEEDYAFLKDAEKKAKDKETKAEADSKDKKGKKDAKADADKKPAVKPINVELEGIDERIVRLSPNSSSLADAIITGDGETLYYLTKTEGSTDLWKMDLRKREPKVAAKMGLKGGASLAADKSGKTLFVLGRDMKKIDPKGDKVTPIAVNASQKIDLPAEREAMFDFMASEEGKRFYNTNMHGVDWPALTAHYRQFLPSIDNGNDYAELLSEVLGELNVSHTGGRFYGDSSDNPDKTASLGLLYDMAYQGDGLKVDEVVTDGPFDLAASKMTPGSIVTAVDGKVLNAGADMTEIFNSIAGQGKVLVNFTTPDGQELSEVVKPILSGRMNDLLYRRWVRRNAQKVKEMSNGRLGYVHIPSMDDASFRPVYADLLGKYNNCEGVVVDIRNNGGGRLHEDIEVLLSGQKYLDQVNRGKAVCNMPSRRYTKPSVMVTNERCYSNAHGTPWVYQHQKLGKVVGAPVAGTMTSVNWVTMQNPDMVFGIPVTGYLTAEGNYLENSELVPDIVVYNTPEEIAEGEDAQLRAAVRSLLSDLDAKK